MVKRKGACPNVIKLSSFPGTVNQPFIVSGTPFLLFQNLHMKWIRPVFQETSILPFIDLTSDSAMERPIPYPLLFVRFPELSALRAATVPADMVCASSFL